MTAASQRHQLQARDSPPGEIRPLASFASDGPYAGAGRGPPGGKLPVTERPRVLVIDDDAGVRLVMCGLLATLGCDTDEAEDGAQGVTLFDRHRYDIVVTDLKMPGLTGWDVVEAVRTRMPTIPIVMVSGFATPADAERAQREGLSFLPKPFQFVGFKAAITQALARRVSSEDRASDPPRRKPLSKAVDDRSPEPETEEGHGPS